MSERKRVIKIIEPSAQRGDSSGEVGSEVEPKKKRVAAYARVSTEMEEQMGSFKMQVEYFKDYIEKNPDWELVEVYADEGVSGTSTKRRSGFNKMIEDAMLGKIDLILTKSISRFARNTVDSLEFARRLKRHGVEVFFQKENLSSFDANSELAFTILSSIAQEESRAISENVRWGKQRSMEEGKVSLPWKSFLGYTKGEDGLPQIVEEEAEVVRRIYNEFLKGASFNKIATRLTKDEIPTPAGKFTWTASTIKSILTNEKYMGDAMLGKTFSEDFLSKKRIKNTGQRKQFYITDSHDAIISPEMFQKVQAEIKHRKERRE